MPGPSEARNRARGADRRPHDAGGAVDERSLRGLRASRKGIGDSIRSVGLANELRRSFPLVRQARGNRGRIGANDDVGIEHGQKRRHVTAPRGGEERVDELRLRDVGVVLRVRALHAASRSAGKPACRRRRRDVLVMLPTISSPGRCFRSSRPD
jgi:hypothetical protein